MGKRTVVIFAAAQHGLRRAATPESCQDNIQEEKPCPVARRSLLISPVASP
jgi:hypothetical protein